jgi:hypothetical protein
VLDELPPPVFVVFDVLPELPLETAEHDIMLASPTTIIEPQNPMETRRARVFTFLRFWNVGGCCIWGSKRIC